VAPANLPRLVLAPGMDGTGELFAPFLRALPAGVGTTVVSYPPRRVLGCPELCDRLRDTLPAEEPFVLVAESFSGPIAIELAASRPSGLRGLVLVASFAQNPLPAPLRLLRPFVRAVLFRVRPPSPLVRWALCGHDAPRGVDEQLTAVLRRSDPTVMAHRARQVFDVDVRRSLPAIAVPVLYLAGARDRVVGLRGLEQIAAGIPALESVVLDAPHLVLQARPDEGAREILRFAAGL